MFDPGSGTTAVLLRPRGPVGFARTRWSPPDSSRRNPVTLDSNRSVTSK
jgi:hypothetical protein